MFGHLQPYDFVHGQPARSSGRTSTVGLHEAGRRSSQVRWTVTHTHVFAVVPATITTALSTAFQATTVIAEITIATAIEPTETVVALILLVKAGRAGAIGRSSAEVGKRV